MFRDKDDNSRPANENFVHQFNNFQRKQKSVLVTASASMFTKSPMLEISECGNRGITDAAKKK